jgi:hypothetical protein
MSYNRKNRNGVWGSPYIKCDVYLIAGGVELGLDTFLLNLVLVQDPCSTGCMRISQVNVDVAIEIGEKSTEF